MTAIVPHPLALIAELTHRCPLHCVYCSNPLELEARGFELSTEIWTRVLGEAGKAGVLQVDFTGGEPLARPDLVELVQAARASGLYVNLITSGMPLDERRLAELVKAGLDHFQLSFQSLREDAASEISGTRALEQKRQVVAWVRAHRVALTLNFVIHRQNLDQLEEMIAFGEESGASRMEFAHVQYYGWAFANRERLLPTREQVERSISVLQQAEARIAREGARGIRGPGLLREVSEGVHGRMGAQADADYAERRRAAVPRGAGDSGSAFWKREGSGLAGDLGFLRCVSKIPGRGVDARALPDLRSPHARLRWLPMSGVFTRGRCRGHRSGVHADATAGDRGRNHRRD